MIGKVFGMGKKKNKNKWRLVKYPTPLPLTLLGFLPLRVLLLVFAIFLEICITLNISDRVHNTIGQFLFIIILFYLIYKTIQFYIQRMKRVRKNNEIPSNLRYLIHSLELYDEEPFEVEKDGKVKIEKRIARVIRIFYREDDKNVYVRVAKDGDRFTQMSSTLGENIESALGLTLDRTNSTVDYFEYICLKFRDRRIDLASSINNEQKNSDVIQISGNISYVLSKTPHSLIVGGTGSGKSFFIFGKILSYLRLTPQADLRIIDPKNADLSLLRFVTGFENKVATEANHICRILREAVELMEQRYSQYFNDISAFGKTYKDFNLPVVIIIFDEFSAFMHSVDKKVAKEALDYVFTLVMKGRQAGCMIEILMQRPSADDLPTNIRSQMGFKAGLGAMDSIGYNMIFDTNNVEYKTVTEKGGGYIQIDGVHTTPVYFETPFIPKDFNFIAEIEKLMKVKQQSDENIDTD